MPSNSPKPMEAQKDSAEEDYTIKPAQEDFIQAQIEDAPARISLKTFLALMAVASQYNAYLFTLLMPSTILSNINEDLGPSPSYSWITVSWNLVAAVVVTVSGRLADIFGRRYFLITGAIFGCIGALVGATAQSINQMIASGVLFGVGGGFQEMCYSCIQELVPNKWRILTIGLFELSALVPFFSPLIAYAMLAHTGPGWRTAYWYMFAYEICGLALLLLFYKLPSFGTKHRRDKKKRLELLRQLDYVGLVLFAAGCICFLLGVSWGGRHYPWKSAAVIVPIVLGVCLLVVLGFWEKFAKLEYPILPPPLFRQKRSFTAVLVVCFVGGMLYYSMNVLWPQQSAAFFAPADDIILRGVYANMVSFGTIMGGVITALICHNVGHERWQMVSFMVIQTALIGSLASVGMDDKVQAIVTIIILSSTVTPPQLLREEDEITYQRTSQLQYLNACLEEGLRIHPPVPAGLLRTVPKAGDVVDGHWVPGGTSVAVSSWAASHNEANFRECDSFIPERWIGDTFATDIKSGMQPFSLGPRGCIGKNLSYMEMRVILTRVIWNFDLVSTDGAWQWDPDGEMKNMKAFNTWQKPDLNFQAVRVQPVDGDGAFESTSRPANPAAENIPV